MGAASGSAGGTGDRDGWRTGADDIRDVVRAAAREGTEVSARLLYRASRSLMRRLGIRTPAELYEILQWLYRDSDEGPSFGDHLSVGFGRTDRGRQVRTFVAGHPGEPKSVLAMDYEREYGFSAGMAAIWIDLFADPGDVSMSAWLGPGEGDGVADAPATAPAAHAGAADDAPVAPVESRAGKAPSVEEFLARELTGDICDAKLVRQRFNYEFRDGPHTAGFDRAVSSAGYCEDHGLLFRCGQTPGDHFARLLAAHPSFSKGDPGFEDAVWKHPAFRSTLRDALREHRVLVYEPESYISFSRLHDVLDVRMATIESYAVAVSMAVPADTPFTVASLRESGLAEHPLYELDMPDAFYEGLLEASDLMRSCLMAKTRIFAVGAGGKMSAASFIDWFVARHEGVERDLLPRLLQEEYGIRCPAQNLSTIVRNSNVHYDDMADAYYSTIEAWKEAVRNELA